MKLGSLFDGSGGFPLAGTLNTIDRPAVAYSEPIAIDRAFFNQGQNAQYDPQFYTDGIVPTLVARGPSGVAYSMKSISQSGKPLTEQANPICASDYKDPDIVAYPEKLHEFIREHNADVPNQQDRLQTADGIARSLVASTHGAASHHTKTVIRYGTRYIVRRLTPTECARLQGFPDLWGHPDHKEDFTDEEWTFWAGVRNTNAAINGKATKSYTCEQMVKWYNGLHTDSAEYKMWGNGIALPCARYVLEGIAEVARGELME